MLLLPHRKYTESLEVLRKELNPNIKQGDLLKEKFTNWRLVKCDISPLLQSKTTNLWRVWWCKIKKKLEFLIMVQVLQLSKVLQEP